MAESSIQSRALRRIEEFRPIIGAERVGRILRKARRLSQLHIVNISSTYHGGGVAELLSSLTLLMNGAGVDTGWRVIQGNPQFFGFTKAMHNGLQGGSIELAEDDMRSYEQVTVENAARMHLDHDLVIVHDPQPLPLVCNYVKETPWIWCCHVDLSDPDHELLDYLRRFTSVYDGIVLSLPEYAHDFGAPRHYLMPAIDPFAPINREMTEAEIEERLAHYKIPTDLPIVLQVSRFDKWKDPQGVIEAYRRASGEVSSTLVLLGNTADDDPEGRGIYESVFESACERIIVLSIDDQHLVNALQRKAAVVLQKSLREGFGLTVTEAMWKGAAVIGGNVGGIRHQIENGVNGFLVDSVPEAASRIVTLLQNPRHARALGRRARESVRTRFLMPRLIEDWLDLIAEYTLAAGPRSSAVRRGWPETRGGAQ